MLLCDKYGGVAQLVERGVRIAEARGSNPLISTIILQRSPIKSDFSVLYSILNSHAIMISTVFSLFWGMRALQQLKSIHKFTSNNYHRQSPQTY